MRYPTVSDDTIYSRWHTPRVVAANALDVLADLADIVCLLPGLYAGVITVSAAIGDSPTYEPSDAPAAALLMLACFGAGRISRWLLGTPATQLHPGLGHFPGWAVPARIRTQVHGHLAQQGEARTGEIADDLGLPRPTVVSALHRLAADGRVTRSGWGAWTSTPASDSGVEGPQVPVAPGKAGDAR
jgi:hypothetical protein